MKPRAVAVAILAALFLGLAVWGCQRQPDTGTGPSGVVININNNQQQQSGNGQASPSPSSAQCAPVQRVGVVATTTSGPDHVTTWRVGQTVRLDATPQGADGPIPSNCTGASVQWTLSGTAACSLQGDVNGFIPNLSCTSSGNIQACAAVAPPGGTGCAAFTVTP